MIRREDERLALEGQITFATTASVLEAAAREARAGATVMDFAAVTDSDSSALALTLELLRQAEAEQRSICFTNMPDTLRKLAELYGLSEMIFQSR